MDIAAGLEYESRGDGEPVLLIHGSLLCDSDKPHMSQPSFAGYRLIRYHRRGYAGSAGHSGPFSVADQARDAVNLLDALSIRRAHVVGHSFGGVIALQLALDAPARVHSLALSEPAVAKFLPKAEAFRERAAPAFQRAAAGDFVGALDALMGGVAGDDWRVVVPRMLPGAVELAEADAPTMAVEGPALAEWQFDSSHARRISHPVLYLGGTESAVQFREGRGLVHHWFPLTEDAEVPGANHLLQCRNPESSRLVAEGIAAFLARHPFS